MGWINRALFSSIGKKQLMALTGLCFCAFITFHLIGNLTLYGGEATFNAYSESLHNLGFLITLTEWGLLILAIIHIALGALLFVENLRARPVRYVMKKRAGGRTWSSALMPYTGLYLIVFILIHLFTFHFVDRAGQTVSQRVMHVFSNPAYVVYYVISVVVAALHVRHGFWSAFQSLGLDHEKYTPIIQGLGLLLSLAVGIGFASIPLFVRAG
jgi:succinate dehydrogenase / fumarate reductase cytochrome b subunit